MVSPTEFTYPCESTDTQELYKKVHSFRDFGDMRRFLHVVSVQDLDWTRIQHLAIYSISKKTSAKKIQYAGFSAGNYVSQDGKLLLVILPHASLPDGFLNCCELCLHTLSIEGCNSLTSLPGLERLTQLTELKLAGCSSLTELPELKNLTQLTKLNLSRCSSLTELPELKNLTQLTELDLSYCSNLTELPGLKTLTQLTKLDLSRCDSLTEFPGLENLTELTTLNLSRCSNFTELPALENLTQLTTLDLAHCNNLTELPGLENLTQLTKLNLLDCARLNSLPDLKNLTQLTYLNLFRVRNLTALPGLENLTQLTHLNLFGCRKLTVLPSLENLTQLTNLNLIGCSNLIAVPTLEKSTNLSKLDLASCHRINELPPFLRNLTSLRRLNLCGMKIRSLPDWLPEIAEKFTRTSGQESGENKAIIYLDKTTVEDIPDMSIFDQPFEVIEEFFRQRSLGQTQMLNEIKVVFLGDGEAGKSHTIARLMNNGGDPVDYTDQATPGIIIKHKYYAADGRTFRVNYWDFGGQEIMHSMHRIFLTDRTMYVVLLNARDDTQGDRAKYWLHNIQSFAPNAPVLLVLNKIDQNPNASVDERDLRGRCEKLIQVVRLSAKDFSQEDFNKAFIDILKEEILKTGFLDAEWPSSWKQVKEKLENMESHYIMGDAYEDLCQECHVDTNQKNLLLWFNNLGVSFCCCDKEDYDLNDYVILRPDWITNALYIILFNRLEGVQNGLIPHHAIYDILHSARSNPNIHCTLPNARYTSGDIGYVLGVMRKFNLSQPHGTDHEFIPMLCQQNSTVDVQYYHKDADTLEFNMEFDYLPNNLLHRLMVERHSELDMDNVWRTGARFQLPELGLSAVVVIDSNTLHFFIRHDNDDHRPNTYLTMLKANVDRIVEKMGLKAPACQLIYKLDGKQDVFDFEMLKAMQDAGQSQAFSMTWRRMLPIEDILNQSAPDGLEDEQKLLDAIQKSCLKIQAEPDYYLKDDENGRGMEDRRNRRIRDDLEMMGYTVKDQTQRGLSGTGRGVGELDLLLYNDRKEPWTIIEALRVSSGAKTQWNEHLDKLVENYNYFGAPCVYLLTYVDADVDAFHRIWEGYRLHIPKHAPGKFTYCADSLIIQESPAGPQYIKIAKCRYDCGGRTTTAYHIFVQIPRQL